MNTFLYLCIRINNKNETLKYVVKKNGQIIIDMAY